MGAKLFVLAATVLACAGWTQDKPPQVEPPGVAAGKRVYTEHCVACHGPDGRGTGPAAPVLKTPPPDLTTLAQRYGGKFPEEYVTDVVRFGKPFAAHGSPDMPVWGPIFAIQEHGNEVAVRRLIKNLCAYLASIQQHEA
jgi:mono/diheme cytochrome c family protein